jgi:hypothetical protein
MFRKIVCAAVVVVLGVGVALAEEFNAAITKVADGKVTFAKTKFNKDTKKLEKGAEETLPTAADVKVVTAKFNKDTKKFEAGEAVKDGLKNEMFAKEVSATIITDADNKKIVEIRVRQAKKGGGN